MESPYFMYSYNALDAYKWTQFEVAAEIMEHFLKFLASLGKKPIDAFGPTLPEMIVDGRVWRDMDDWFWVSPTIIDAVWTVLLALNSVLLNVGTGFTNSYQARLVCTFQ